MLDTLLSPTITSYIKEIRKVDPSGKPAIVIPVKPRLKAILINKKKTATLPDLPFEEWNLPAQENGYIKCGKHDFL